MTGPARDADDVRLSPQEWKEIRLHLEGLMRKLAEIQRRHDEPEFVRCIECGVTMHEAISMWGYCPDCFEKPCDHAVCPEDRCTHIDGSVSD